MLSLHATYLLDTTMNTIRDSLSFTPVPCLVRDIVALKLICSSIEQAQTNKCQLETLAQSIAQLLETLDGLYRAEKLQDVLTSTPLVNLHTFVG
jgi:hypothetical protein